MGKTEQTNSLDLSRNSDEHTNDETQTRVSDQYDNQSDDTSNKLFEPMSAQPSHTTSRRASFDSQGIESLKVNKDQMTAPSFVPTTTFNPSFSKPFMPSAMAAPYFKPSPAPAKPAPAVAPSGSSLMSGLNSLSSINNDFTPSTPYVHKFRTEMCKNFELYGKCKYGDEVSILIFLIRSSFKWAFFCLLTCFHSHFEWQNKLFDSNWVTQEELLERHCQPASFKTGLNWDNT